MTALRTAARIAVVAGAVGSVGLMLYVGRRNQSYWLLLLFVLWDVAPFAALGLADEYAKRWSAPTRTTLHVVTLIVTLASLAVYADVIVRPRPQPAAPFLLVPVASWLLMAIALPMASYVSGRR